MIVITRKNPVKRLYQQYLRMRVGYNLYPLSIEYNSTFILRCQSAQHIQLFYESGSKTGILLGTRKCEIGDSLQFHISSGLARPNTFSKFVRGTICPPHEPIMLLASLLLLGRVVLLVIVCDQSPFRVIPHCDLFVFQSLHGPFLLPLLLLGQHQH